MPSSAAATLQTSQPDSLWYRGAVGLTIAACLGMAWHNHFIQDDAFIVFRYARNLAEGNGLTWNAGEPVEGYTTFLYTLLMAPAFALKVNPIWYSYALGLACHAIGLFAFFIAARATLDDKWWAIVAVALLGTNYTFSIFATGGLETSLDAALICIALAAVARHQRDGWSLPSTVVLFLLAALALLTRLDAGIPLGVLIAVAMRRAIVQIGLRPALRRFVVAALPGALMLAAWATWKMWYYGDLLPNTFYVKVDSPLGWSVGAWYVYYFLTSYWLLPFALLGIVMTPQLMRGGADALLASYVATPLWLAYMIRVGGDFMEFRFLVPMLPFLMMILVSAIAHLATRWSIGAALVLGVIAGSANHAMTFDFLRYEVGKPLSRDLLRAFLVNSGRNWIGIGRALARDLPRSDVRIAVTAAGAIPFYSRLQAVDMLGLNDRWVARHGELMFRIPGHQRLAPLSYLVDREVHLLIGHPQLVNARERPIAYPASFLSQIRVTDPTSVPLLAPLRVVEMPVDASHVAAMVYLTPHADIDRLVTTGRWRAVPLARE